MEELRSHTLRLLHVDPSLVAFTFGFIGLLRGLLQGILSAVGAGFGAAPVGGILVAPLLGGLGGLVLGGLGAMFVNFLLPRMGGLKVTFGVPVDAEPPSMP